jgi:hypothetical protein
LETSFAVLSPYDFSAVADSPFGIATHLHRGQKNTVPLIQQAGAKSVRDGVEWNNIEKTKGVYTFSPVPDDYMAELKEHDLGMLFVAAYNNPFYDNNATPYTDQGREGLANYAEAYVDHYKDQLIAMEAYNEFHGGFGKRGNSPANSKPDYYFKLLKKTYETVKAEHPEFPVHGIVASEDVVSWIEEVFKLGGLQYLDAVTLHPYRYPNEPEGLTDSLEKIKALMRQYNNGEEKPIWITEFGYPTFKAANGIDEITQANYLVRYYVAAISNGVEKIYWYDLVNDGLRPDYNEDNFGILRNATDPLGAFTPKPAYAAYAAMTRELTDAQFIREEPLEQGLKSYLFDKNGQNHRVVWSLTPASAVIRTNQPVEITDMMGNVQTFTPFNGSIYVTLTGEPLYIKGEIEGLYKDATFRVSGGSALAGELVTLQVEMNNSSSETLNYTLEIEGGQYSLDAGPGQTNIETVVVEGLEEPGTRLVKGVLKAGGQTIGLLQHAAAVTPSELIQIRPIINDTEPPSQAIKVQIRNNSKVNGLPVHRVDWQLGTLSGHQELNAVVQPDTIEVFDIVLQGIELGKSYTANVTVDYGNNKTHSYAGSIEFNPIYTESIHVDGIPDPLIVAESPTIELSKGNVKVSGYNGAGDLSGSVWLNFDKDHFYLTARIKDDIHAFPATDVNIWNNDSIQFAISNGLPGEEPNYYEYGISQTSVGPQIHRWITPSGVPKGVVSNGELQVTRDEGQKMTMYELALPWSELTPIQTKSGVMSFSLLVNENDGNLRRGYIEWGSGIGDGKAPSKFRTMQWVREPAATVLEVHNAVGAYSDEVQLRAMLKDESAHPISGERIDFLVDGVHVGTEQTDAQGVATIEYKIDQGAAGDTGSWDIQVKAIYGGNQEAFYQGSEALGAITITKEDVSVVYTGSQITNVNDGLILGVSVLQDQDGSYGTLEGLPVQFVLSEVNPGGGLNPLVATVTGSTYTTDASGHLSIPIRLPAGYYQVKTQLLNNLYYKETEMVSNIAVYDSEASEFKINGFFDIANSDFMGEMAKKVHLNVQLDNGDNVKLKKLRIHAEPQGRELTITGVDWQIVSRDNAYLQGRAESGGETYTVRMMTRVPDSSDHKDQFLSLLIWKGTDTTADKVFQTFRAPLSGNININ